jgi:hypothetical protein
MSEFVYSEEDSEDPRHVENTTSIITTMSYVSLDNFDSLVTAIDVGNRTKQLDTTRFQYQVYEGSTYDILLKGTTHINIRPIHTLKHFLSDFFGLPFIRCGECKSRKSVHVPLHFRMRRFRLIGSSGSLFFL